MRKLLLIALVAVALATPARAAFGPSAGILFHPLVRITAPLSSISDISVNADLDSTLSASYGGSGTAWSSLITTPADGSTQAGNAYTNSGAFTGTAGQSSAYFLLNGSSTNAVLASGTNTSFLSALQNDASSWWVAITFNLGGTAAGTLWSSQSTTSAAGMSLVINAGGTPKFSLTQYTSASKQIFAWSPTTSPAAGVEYVVIVSHNAGGNTRVWLNSSTNTAESSTLFTAASVSASRQMTFGSRSSASLLPSGTHLSNVSYGPGYLSNAQAGEIIHLLESRHQVDYDGNGIIGN